MDPRSNLSNPKLALIVIASLVKRLGGNVTITQADIDAVAYGRLIEDGSLVLKLQEVARSD